MHTVGALASRSEDDLLAIDGLGPQSIREIKQKLADHGLALNGTTAGPADAGPDNTGPGNTGPAGAADGHGAATGATRSTTQGLNGALPPAAAARPADQDVIDLLGVAGRPVLKRALPAVGLLGGLLLLLVLRSRRKRRRATAG